MCVNDDTLEYIDEQVDDLGVVRQHVFEPWRILVVDDDEDVHQSTVFALRDSVILGRTLEFLHAYNSAAATEILHQVPDIALILLDVVMETEDSGLTLIGHIREEIGLVSVRIILRTGQPGYAPDVDAITRYDINDYKTKAELSRSRLFTTVTAAIRSFDQITHLETSRRGLKLIGNQPASALHDQGMPAYAASEIGRAHV